MCGNLKLILTVFIGILLVSCTRSTQENRSIINNINVVDAVDKETHTDQLVVDLPIKLDSLSDHIIFQIRNINGEPENKVSYNSRKNYNDNYLRNLIFQNIETEQTRVLTVDKIRIISYEQLYKANNETENVILYQIIDTFSEDDEALTLTSLYLSRNNGKSFKKVSAKNHHLSSWEYSPELHKIFFKTIEDSDSNNKLNNSDKHYIYSVSIEDFKATKLFTDELKTIKN